jgi:DNA end-binding protein Ku
MPQAVWTGSLSFGLVSIPVKLYGANAPQDVRFHQYEAGTRRRIRYRRVAAGPPPDEGEPGEPGQPATSSEAAGEMAAPASQVATPRRQPEAAPAGREPAVAWEDIVKGYEIEPGRVVTVSPGELLDVAPERSRVLEVEEFVDLQQIDPVYFEKAYYVLPQPGMAAERPYWLLLRAMQASQKVAIGRFVMRTREYLAAVRPGPDVLTLETLFFADEVRDPQAIWTPVPEEPSERELRVARQLVEALAADWDPSGHRDTQRERVLELLRGKAEEAFVLPAPEEEAAPAPKAVDLMAALKASVEAARQARGGPPGKGSRRTG